MHQSGRRRRAQCASKDNASHLQERHQNGRISVALCGRFRGESRGARPLGEFENISLGLQESKERERGSEGLQDTVYATLVLEGVDTPRDRCGSPLV